MLVLPPRSSSFIVIPSGIGDGGCEMLDGTFLRSTLSV
jgi:hypothetical protein